MKKATFGSEYIVEEKMVSRPTVTVNRTGGFATNEKDLIVCGCCGAVETWKAKFCMGCGAKFKLVKDVSQYKEYEALVNGHIDGQLSFLEGVR